MDRIVRVAVMGMGKMGIAHAAILNTMKEAELIGIVDSNLRQLRHVESLGLRVPFYLSLSELCSEGMPDALFVCTPPSSHLQIARESVQRGIHTFIEKPLAESVSNARKILRLGREKGIVHATGFNLAYVPVFRHVKCLLDKFKLGEVERFSGEMYLTKVMGVRQADKGWQFDPKISGGGVLTNVGSHLLFLLLWYFGNVESVRAREESKFSSRVEDEVSAELYFENGIWGEFKTSWSVPGHPVSNVCLEIHAKDALMTVSSEWIHLKRHHIQLGSSCCAYEERIHVSDLENDDLFTLGGEGYYAQDAAFLSCIHSGSTPTVSWAEGAKVQLVIEAIYRSCKNGGVVNIKETMGGLLV